MSFTTADNPHIRPDLPKPKSQRYEANDGRVFETTGEIRPAKKGEYIVGPMSALMGPAQANRDTDVAYPILKEVR